MNEEKPASLPESHLDDSIPTRRGLTPGGQQPSRLEGTDPKRVEIVLRIARAEPQPSESPIPVAEVQAKPASVSENATDPVLIHPGDSPSFSREAGKGE